ncbi:MAG TPA: ribosome maturation factor RimM [Xanthobacteraceae bacterium]|nr:ribosome maturation factor RimM [Xanthobacteraceae bacterium]
MRAQRPSGEDARVCLAQIGAPHGLAGEVRLHAFTEEPLAVGRYGTLEAEDRSRQFELTALRLGKRGLIAAFAGVADRTAAARLTAIRLYVPRARLPDPDDADTFYHADLVGLTVEAADGLPIGTVCAVHDFGAGDLLEVKPAIGPSLMLPFTKAAVPVVDLAAARLVAALPGPPRAAGPSRPPKGASRHPRQGEGPG